MSDDQVGCEWVSVSSGTGLPVSSRTKAVKRLCVCVCVRVSCSAIFSAANHINGTKSAFCNTVDENEAATLKIAS